MVRHFENYFHIVRTNQMCGLAEISICVVHLFWCAPPRVQIVTEVFDLAVEDRFQNIYLMTASAENRNGTVLGRYLKKKEPWIQKLNISLWSTEKLYEYTEVRE